MLHLTKDKVAREEESRRILADLGMWLTHLVWGGSEDSIICDTIRYGMPDEGKKAFGSEEVHFRVVVWRARQGLRPLARDGPSWVPRSQAFRLASALQSGRRLSLAELATRREGRRQDRLGLWGSCHDDWTRLNAPHHHL